MGRKSYSRRMNINAAVWLIGLGILWLTDLWWPGILILVGISMLVQTMGPREAPEPVTPVHREPMENMEAEPVVKDSPEADIWDDEVDAAEQPAFMQPGVEKDNSLLPAQCPACGGPVAENGHKVEWIGARTAKCPFCDTVLNL